MVQRRLKPEDRSQLLARIDEARTLTDALFRRVPPERLYDRPIPERHRLVFYLAHLETFDWNLLGRSTLGLKSFHPKFDQLFAFGVDPVDGHLPDDKPTDWPALEEIENYNQEARQALDQKLRKADWSDPAFAFLADGTIVHAIIEHRLMHAETLVYMMHHLPPEMSAAAPCTSFPTSFTPRRAEIPSGSATLGQRRAAGQFGWDNEFEAHQVTVPAFAIDTYPVTNGQFLEFVRAGGYGDHTLWTDADWEWKERHGLVQPHFWRRRSEQWLYRAQFCEVPLPLDWPVYVSYAEASAYAHWAGRQLPTEAQWHRATYGTADGPERAHPWGDEPPTAARGNFDFQSWDATPVDAHPAGRSAFGVEDLLGNGW
ncbi:MAG TPA: SUMF1/EgtB/PvdO family nonheme iron enzyme, partial [Candidatus Acidoferrales bacterium]|nr:SUMF1/EgtB/PvdO family nonheme iron enzyme [Candidatus Acidoferrales bacterium]